jgi:hypothetical protein
MLKDRPLTPLKEKTMLVFNSGILEMSAAANLTMYLADLNQTVAATAATLINASGEGSAIADGVATMVIPKRIPVDSAEWFKTFGRQFMDTEVNRTRACLTAGRRTTI